MQGLKDLLESERGWFCLAVLLAATVLAAMKVITGADWVTLAKYLVVTLVASKTLSAVSAALPSSSATPPPTA